MQEESIRRLSFDCQHGEPSEDYVEGFLDGIAAGREELLREPLPTGKLVPSDLSVKSDTLIGEWKGHELRHNYGKRSDINTDWWQGHNEPGWACFGPYIRLAAGRYRFVYDVRILCQKPTRPNLEACYHHPILGSICTPIPSTWRDNKDAIMHYDVTYDSGRNELLANRKDWVDVWAIAEQGQYDGTVSQEFSLSDTTSNIEVRITATVVADECHYQKLRIYKID